MLLWKKLDLFCFFFLCESVALKGKQLLWDTLMFLTLYFVRLANHSPNELQCGQQMQVEPACVHWLCGGLGPRSGHLPAEKQLGQRWRLARL